MCHQQVNDHWLEVFNLLKFNHTQKKRKNNSASIRRTCEFNREADDADGRHSSQLDRWRVERLGNERTAHQRLSVTLYSHRVRSYKHNKKTNICSVNAPLTQHNLPAGQRTCICDTANNDNK